MLSLFFEQEKQEEGYSRVAGVDEAGRGPLAGPVSAAAVILPKGFSHSLLDDSKKLSEKRRETLYEELTNRGDVIWALSLGDVEEIDAINILAATMLAMRRAILGLSVFPTAVRVDGNRLPDLRFSGRHVEGEAIVGGDGKVAAISAASIIAKTTRDRFMIEMDVLYPDYGFAKHKGYGTELHRQHLQEFGPCQLHRRSFAPVRLAQ